MRSSHVGTGRRKRLLTRAFHGTALVLILALAFGPIGLVSASAADRSRDGSFSSDTDVVSEERGGGGGSSTSTGSVLTRTEGSSAETPGHEPLSHGGASVQIDFQAANPGTYDHAGGGALAGFGFANTTSTLNGGDFACGDSVVFLVKAHVGSGYAGAPITGLAYNFAKDPTGQPGAGYTGVGGPSLVQTDAAYDDQGAGALISNVSISANATHHILSFDLSGVDGALPAPDGSGDTIIFRFTATLGCVAGQSPTGQIQANQVGVGGNDTVNLGVAGLATPAALTITKTSPTTNVTFNTNITWTITVTNTGGSNATNVIVTDTIPPGFVLVSATPSQGTCGLPTVTCNLGTITANGGTATVAIVATAPSVCGPFINSASGTFSTGQAIPGSPASHSGTVVGCPGPGTPAPVISKAVSGGGSVDVSIGANISWTVTVSNAAGTADATNVIVSDPLPAGFVLVSATPSQGTCGNPAVTCNLGTIAAGASASVTITATAPSTCGPYTNTATGTFGAAAPVTIPPSGNSVSGQITGCAPVLSLSKSGPTTVTQGQNITWTVTVTNSGTADASNVVVTDTLPAGFTFVSSSPGAPTCTEVAGVVTCTIASVPKGGGQVSISIEATAPTTCGPFTNTAVSGNLNASASGNVTNCPGPNPSNPALAIVKTAAGSVVQPGGLISFTITVSSTGNVAASDVLMNDTLPTIPGVTWSITGGSGAGSCTIAGNVLSCNYGSVPAGSSLSVVVSTTPTTTASCGAYTNTATADASNTAPVSASASTRVECPTGAGGIDITKTGPATAKVGDTVTYNFGVVLASGSPSLTGVSVTDPICDPGTLAGPTGDDGDNVLEGGETWGFSCTHVVTGGDPDPLPNTATVCATAPGGGTVCDSDNHEVDITHPAIEVVKAADPTSGTAGTVITYSYTVTNSGDVPLFDVTVDDDVLGPICDIAVLQPQSTEECTGTYTIPAGSPSEITNIVIAGGTDPAGDLVEDQDDFTITVVAGTTVTKTPPGGVAFTGPATAIPIAALALLLLAAGSGLLWLGRRRGHLEGTQG